MTITRTSALTSTLTTTSTSLVDLTGFTTSVVSKGGWLRIEIVPADAAGSSANPLHFTHPTAQLLVAAAVGATVLPSMDMYSSFIPVTAWHWMSKPAAGTYTVKLQWMVTSGTGTLLLTSTGGAVLQVTEYIAS